MSSDDLARPGHPIARTFALRSHLPLIVRHDGPDEAVAHRAAATIDRNGAA